MTEKIPLGEITDLALSYDKRIISMFSKNDGAVIVMGSNLINVYSIHPFGIAPPEKLIWCGKDLPVMVIDNTLYLLNKNQMQEVKLTIPKEAQRAPFKKKGQELQGFAFCQEIDGLRVITNHGVYFIQRLQEAS